MRKLDDYPQVRVAKLMWKVLDTGSEPHIQFCTDFLEKVVAEGLTPEIEKTFYDRALKLPRLEI